MHYMQDDFGGGKKVTCKRKKDDVYSIKGGAV